MAGESRVGLEKALCSAFAGRCGTMFMRLYAATASSENINLSDLRCLLILAESGPLTAGELARHSGNSTAATALIVNRLEAAGTVRRETDPADRRKVIVHIDASSALAHTLSRQQQQIMSAMTAIMTNFSDAELRKTTEFLELAAQAMSRSADAVAGVPSTPA